MQQTRPHRLLITGAGGFVGPHLLRAAKQSRLSFEGIQACTKNPSEIQVDDDVVRWCSMDILDASAMRELIASFRPTHVIHLAAISHVPTANRNPQLVWSVNLLGTLNLLEALKYETPDAVLLFASSSETYGRSFLQGEPLTEKAELQPRNPYAATKAAAEQMLVQYVETGLRIIRARPFNHIGPGQTEDFVVPAFAAQIARIEARIQLPIMKVGNLEAKRDFLDVQDVANAYISLLENAADLPNGAAFNIASGTERSIHSILIELKALSNAEFSIEEDPERLRPSDTPIAMGNSDKLRQATGWTPQLDWDQTLQSILDDWRQRVNGS